MDRSYVHTLFPVAERGLVCDHIEDRKAIDHPLVGPISVDCDVLHAGDSGLKIVVLTTPVGSEDATKIEVAGMAGLAPAGTGEP